MKNIKYLILMLFSASLLISCNSDDDNGSDVDDRALIGTWEATGIDDDVEFTITATFRADQTGTLATVATFEGETETESENFTWSTNGNRLTLSSSSDSPQTVTYSISGNRLTITDDDGFVTVLTKR